MRIAHIVSTFPPYRGGIGNAVFHYARELSLLGHDIGVYTPDYGPVFGSTEPQNGKGSETIEPETGFKVHRLLPWLKYGNAALTPQLFWKLSSYDIIHLHYPFFGGAEWILLLKWLFVKPPRVVLSYHMDVIGEGPLKLFFKGYGKSILPSLIGQSDLVLVSSRDYAETSLISRFLDKKPCYEISYGVSSQFYPKDKNKKLMDRLKLLPEDKVLLFVGGLDRAHYFKGVSVLIEAVGKLNRKEVKLLIVGNGDRIPAYREEVKKENLEDRVLFITGVADQDLPDYYNLADLAALPSINRSEAFGIVLLEAMACGKPVVGSSLPGVRTVVEDRVNGLLVRPGDSGDLKEKVGFLLDHRDVASAYGLAGFKKAEEHFRWNQIVRQMEKAYQNLIGGGPLINGFNPR